MDHLADVHLADVSGMMPLHYAGTSNSLAALKLLVNNGADLSAKDKDRGWTPLHYAAFSQMDPSWVEEVTPCSGPRDWSSSISIRLIQVGKILTKCLCE